MHYHTMSEPDNPTLPAETPWPTPPENLADASPDRWQPVQTAVKMAEESHGVKRSAQTPELSEHKRQKVHVISDDENGDNGASNDSLAGGPNASLQPEIHQTEALVSRGSMGPDPAIIAGMKAAKALARAAAMHDGSAPHVAAEVLPQQAPAPRQPLLQMPDLSRLTKPLTGLLQNLIPAKAQSPNKDTPAMPVASESQALIAKAYETNTTAASENGKNSFTEDFISFDTIHPFSKKDDPDLPVPPALNEPHLCPEQARLVDLIVSGKNVFYTGSAGCGKSTVLKAFTRRLRAMDKDVRILAPTGRAALQVNGLTTWAYAGWRPDHQKRTLDELRQGAHTKFVWKRLTKTDVLVIDEISMVENLHFERLNAIMKEARNRPHLAFGGVQVVVTGDFCQLPPVKPFQHCMECGKEFAQKASYGSKTYTCRVHGEYRDEDKWAFKSKAWQECNFVHVHLNTIHRQNDQTFIRMLQKCRIGDNLSSYEVDLLMNHPCKVHNATKLFATRDEVNTVNKEAFNKLTGLKHTYWCRDTFVFEGHRNLLAKGKRAPRGSPMQQPLLALDDHKFSDFMELKPGMLVVLLVNLDLPAGLCNGSQGIVCGFEDYDAAKLPKAKIGRNDPENPIHGERAAMKEAEIKAFITGKGALFKKWPVVRFHNGCKRTIFADCSITELGDERPYSLLSRTQIPLAPAWAMTIHKSQSLTLDRVIVNLSKAFEEGQIYVALSRATGLEGLRIDGDASILRTGLGGNREVQRFLREMFGPLNAFSTKAIS